MSTLERRPSPALRPFVRTLWASEQPAASTARERLLPTGQAHLVFRLGEHPLRVFASLQDAVGASFGPAVVGGPRAAPYLRDVSTPSCAVGAMLYPGAAQVLFGVPSDELAGRHTDLADLWGCAAATAQAQLREACSPARRLERLEALLLARVQRARAVHPAVAMALARFAQAPGARGAVRAAVADSGYSHRRFIELFRRAVGLAPKEYGRVLRLQRALALAGAPGTSWADVAAAAGYSDQPHLNREFRELAGLSPGEYRALAPASPHHVPIADEVAPARSIPSKTASTPLRQAARARRAP